MAGIQIKVSPAQLKLEVSNMQNSIFKFEKDWNRINGIVGNMGSYWGGEAFSKNQSLKNKAENEMASRIKDIKQMPVKLLKMADLYDDTENNVIQLSNSLPGDAIK